MEENGEIFIWVIFMSKRDRLRNHEQGGRRWRTFEFSSNSSNHFFSWLIKLAQQWGELLYKGSGSSALVGRFDWKSTLEVCCIVSAGLMLGPFVFFFNHYGFDLFVSGHGLIPWHSPLKFLDTFLKFIALQVIGRHPCPKVPNEPRFGTLPPRCFTVSKSRPSSSNRAQS